MAEVASRSAKMSKKPFKRSKSLLAKDLQEAIKDLDKVECSQLWLRKMKTLFNAFDIDRTGFLHKQSFEDLPERFRKYANSTKEQRDYMASVLLEWWREVAKGDEPIPWEQYYKLKWVIITDPDLQQAEKEIADEFIKKMFQITDLDQNGTISLAEWRIFQLAFGVTKQEDADETFEKMDLNGDGVISYEEYVTGFKDFSCNQEESQYTYILGPLAEV